MSLLSSAQFVSTATAIFQESGAIGVDLETTGLSPYKDSRAFILGFTDTLGHEYSVRLDSERADYYHPRTGILEGLRILFSSKTLTYCAHNAKFELAFLKEQFGIDVKGIVWDTEVMARVQYNNHMKYGLQACAERIGEIKYPPMLAWLKANKRKGLIHHHAPEDLIVPYVEQDAWLSWKLYNEQVATFKHWDTSSPVKIKPVVSLEISMTTRLFEMERTGLLLNVNYCRRARDYEIEKRDEAKRDFERLTAIPFVDSRKTLQPIFDSYGIRYGHTELGNASFTEDNLAGAKDHPIVRALLSHRRAVKRISSYWDNFLELEHNGIIHPSINQNRADTGRMSISDPSCQNWPTDEDDPEFPIRRAFIARPGSKIVSMDYSQMELRLICDEAADMGMIKAFQEGADFHQQVADFANVPRSLAKNGRFAKLYGAGVKKVADTLGVSFDVAQAICEALDRSSPRVAEYSRELIRYAETAPFCHDFLGRRFYFDPGFSYKYPNYKIQGGCGEILRLAIRDIHNLLQNHKAKMLIPIHDELLFDMPVDEFHLIPEIKALMIAAHRNKKYLDMDVSVNVGDNFHDLEEYV